MNRLPRTFCATIQPVPAGLLARRYPSPVPSHPDTLTRQQAGYLAVILALGVTATQAQAAKAARVAERTLQKWRADSRTGGAFRRAETEVLRLRLYAQTPDAIAAYSRLLRADIDYGAPGLAATQRAADRVLEGAGILPGRYSQAVTVNAGSVALSVAAPALSASGDDAWAAPTAPDRALPPATRVAALPAPVRAASSNATRAALTQERAAGNRVAARRATRAKARARSKA